MDSSSQPFSENEFTKGRHSLAGHEYRLVLRACVALSANSPTRHNQQNNGNSVVTSIEATPCSCRSPVVVVAAAAAAAAVVVIVIG
jgi:hypothetical protein